jgi:programmed cell death 6-interacting protein
MTGVKINQLREATSLLNTVLASLNLPAALEDTQGGSDDVPQSLKEKARLVHEMGGSKELFTSVQEIPELVQRNKEILDEAERLLREEEESDNQLRAQLKEKWTRTPSEKLNATFKTNAARYREIINNALAADEVVRGKLATHEQAIQMLSRGEHGLADVVPKSSATKSATGSESAKQNLKRLMGEVEELKRERETLETQYKDTVFDMKTPFLKALAQDGAINEPVMSVELLDKVLGPLGGKTTSNLEQQERVIVGIQQNSEEYFGKKPEGNDTLSRRDQIMRQLAEGYDAYTDLQNNIKEGRKFYNDLTQLLVAFQNKISDFCFARKTEKEELLRDVTRDASSGSSGGLVSAPPRPPPPTVSSAPHNSAAAAAPHTAQQPPFNPGAQAHTPYNPGAPPAYPGAQPTAMGAAGGALPYPPSYPQNMPMPMSYQQQNMAPYPFTPMPATFNPYATFPLPSRESSE